MTEKNTIISEINTYINKFGKPYSAWYIGIATNPKERLFSDHCVMEKGGYWIYRTANTDTIAREIEKIFLDAGATGGPSGGDEKTCSVYAYLITNTTVE